MNNNRYSVTSTEDYELGSDGKVLNNKLGIKIEQEMNALEEKFLRDAEIQLLGINANHQFTSQDICDIHELWLGDIYYFAGKYRISNMSKDGFFFASSEQIYKLMDSLEKRFLSKYTPCNFKNDQDLAQALGIVHAELILIHPFREGNGRTARLLADLMSMQANRPPLNYSYISQLEEGIGFKHYISAIHTALDSDYLPITRIFEKLLSDSAR